MKAIEPADDRERGADDDEASARLLALLDESFAEIDSGLPPHLWERALLGPAREFLRRPGKQFRARLVEVCWRLAGGDSAMPIELPLVVELLHAGSLIVDDIEDGSSTRRGGPALHHLYGTSIALNTGNWMYFWPLTLIDRLDQSSERSAEMHRRTRQTLVLCHQGQALDLALKVTELEQSEVPHVVRATTRSKTSALMSLAAALGAIAAGAESRVLDAVTRFGTELGVGLQMLDDLGSLASDSRRHKGREDLRLARPTWPWAWAAQSASAQVFAELQQRAVLVSRGDSDRAALDELARALCELVGDTGWARVHTRLSLALAVLGDALGPSPELSALEDEIARLERSYV
ncbi:polyprenyl synthetase family protein [Haliangium ochraceum]|uniref:Polyprenyl synthetase n=1 Tax=Haliangium ochraceum (strain DSM 14365 / JCM 11303 / SMP-2) TaxID=502025 RepID=D0LHS6_HALO1|nr:polyprenyl synthetase family protein [Haliangium ochraceum]ACY14755.1 Polyprenyl synthetase [Haliangium ochraceum DSM 14365]